MMVSCKYVVEHRIPLQSVKAHEKQCFLKQHGYSEKDDLLPDAADPNAQSVVKLSMKLFFLKINYLETMNRASDLKTIYHS